MNLIFDYDGTLHNTLKIYAPAFRKAYEYLASLRLAPARKLSDQWISRWLGEVDVEMWRRFMPEISLETIEICRKIISTEMKNSLDSGCAELFEGTYDTLGKLKNDGHTILFLSNCREIYQKRHAAYFGLDKYFSAYYCAESFNFIPKHEIFKKFCNNYNGEFIMIGDRYHDMEVSVLNGLRSIGCGYGYGADGELENADIIVNSIKEIPEAVRTLQAQ